MRDNCQLMLLLWRSLATLATSAVKAQRKNDPEHREYSGDILLTFQRPNPDNYETHTLIALSCEKSSAYASRR